MGSKTLLSNHRHASVQIVVFKLLSAGSVVTIFGIKCSHLRIPRRLRCVTQLTRVTQFLDCVKVMIGVTFQTKRYKLKLSSLDRSQIDTLCVFFVAGKKSFWSKSEKRRECFVNKVFSSNKKVERATTRARRPGPECLVAAKMSPGLNKRPYCVHNINSWVRSICFLSERCDIRSTNERPSRVVATFFK